MRRKEKLDFEFNKEAFAELLDKARGKLTIKAYAEECGISVTYMGKYLNGKILNPPSLPTIRTIARYTSKHGVSEEDLLRAAGYDASKYSGFYQEALEAILREKRSMGVIKNALFSRQFQWQLVKDRFPADMIVEDFYSHSDKDADVPKDDNYYNRQYDEMANATPFDLHIKIDSDQLDEWMFCFGDWLEYPKKEREFYDDLVKRFYEDIIFREFPENAKLSIVADKPDIFIDFKEYHPKLLPIWISVILVDTRDLSIVREEYLTTRRKLTDAMKTEFVLAKQKD